jgi:hypothetical protein
MPKASKKTTKPKRATSKDLKEIDRTLVDGDEEISNLLSKLTKNVASVKLKKVSKNETDGTDQPYYNNALLVGFLSLTF